MKIEMLYCGEFAAGLKFPLNLAVNTPALIQIYVCMLTLLREAKLLQQHVEPIAGEPAAG